MHNSLRHKVGVCVESECMCVFVCEVGRGRVKIEKLNTSSFTGQKCSFKKHYLVVQENRIWCGIKRGIILSNTIITSAVGGSKGPYNWLTQSSMDTYADTMLSSMDTSSSSALLFTIGKSSTAPQRAPTKPGANFGKERLGARPKDTNTGDNNMQACCSKGCQTRRHLSVYL